jgi:hydroxypyruvate reductase
MDRTGLKNVLQRIFQAGVAAAHPKALSSAAWSHAPQRPAQLLAAGKAAVEMAEACLAAGIRPRGGLVVARRGQGRHVPGLALLEAAHPVPDGSSVRAAEAMLSLAVGAQPGEDVLVLLSGGASSLLCAPLGDLGLVGKQRITQSLLASGASITEINLVRRHLSRIKGGRLAAAVYPARVTTLAISDVVGDDPADIASGPTVADSSGVGEAAEILARYDVAPPPSWSESVKPQDPRLDGASFRLIGSAGLSLEAAAAAARREGFQPVDLGAAHEGEARRLGAIHSQALRAYLGAGRPTALISGGELTVTLRGSGAGGPNFEYVAALGLGVQGLSGVCALAGDTDGVDGNSGACGAFVFGDSAARAAAAGLSLDEALASNNAAEAFARLADVYAPGPSGTNVNDLRIILVNG